jgi:hypothetical protein
MRWEQSRAAIDRMLSDGELQRVPASRQQADRLLAQARVHAASALKVCDADPSGGYALAYDGARKALTAILENEGLRPTTRGGHLAVAACRQASRRDVALLITCPVGELGARWLEAAVVADGHAGAAARGAAGAVAGYAGR